jgi:glutathione S-transferase
VQQHYPGTTRLVPDDPERARDVRFKDRFFDLYVHAPMQKIVGDKLRPANARDAHGVAEAKAQIGTALGIVDREMAEKTWAMGDEFTLADCAAGPPLFYIDKMTPLAGSYQNVAAYLARLKRRPSYARALEEAQPYLSLFPG